MKWQILTGTSDNCLTMTLIESGIKMDDGSLQLDFERSFDPTTVVAYEFETPPAYEDDYGTEFSYEFKNFTHAQHVSIARAIYRAFQAGYENSQ